MRERTLARSGIRVSELSLGTWGLGAQSYGPVSEEDARAVLVAARDAGVTTFDMAPLWGDGRAERLVAESVGARRDELVYVTRGGAARLYGGVRHRFDPLSLQQDCELSLRRLGTDRIDLWLLHAPPSSIWERDEWQRAVERLQTSGKIRAWGAAVATAEAARPAIAAGAHALCLPYNILASDALSEVADQCRQAGCGVLACSPLAYGLLAAKWPNDHEFAAGDHRADRWAAEALRERIRQANMLRFLLHDGVDTLASAAFRYALSNDTVTSVVMGPRNSTQLADPVRASEQGPPFLPDEDLARIPQVLAASGL